MRGWRFGAWAAWQQFLAKSEFLACWSAICGNTLLRVSTEDLMPGLTHWRKRHHVLCNFILIINCNAAEQSNNCLIAVKRETLQQILISTVDYLRFEPGGVFCVCVCVCVCVSTHTKWQLVFLSSGLFKALCWDFYAKSTLLLHHIYIEDAAAACGTQQMNASCWRPAGGEEKYNIKKKYSYYYVHSLGFG